MEALESSLGPKSHFNMHKTLPRSPGADVSFLGGASQAYHTSVIETGEDKIQSPTPWSTLWITQMEYP